ncbi:MAG: hypothetical protein CW336_05170 [Bacteroidetes bacterium]|nr:hypothetical protein [Bacteroidota bacterium]
MKKLLLILSLFASLSLEAQFVTTFAKNTSETQEDGVFYYLPRNVIRLEFTIEETDYYIGPYAEFATKLLGTTDYIKENKSVFNIQAVDIQAVNDIDPNAVYCISPDEKSKEPLPNIILNNDGIILALGHDNVNPIDVVTRNSFNDNYLDAEKKEISFVEILDNEVELDDDDDEEEGSSHKKITKEDKAKAALEKISKIREAYSDLVSGVQEVAYGNTLPYMIDNVKSLENEYVSLFKGKTVKSTYKKVIYYVPEENTDGIVEVGGKGEAIKIQFDSRNSLANINPMSDDANKTGQINKIFYRIPAVTDVKILVGNKVFAEKSLTISQFGIIKTMSAKNNKILFNPNTGQIISVSH